MGDSWSVGAWHETDLKYGEHNADSEIIQQASDLDARARQWGFTDTGVGHNVNYHPGLKLFLTQAGHDVEMLGKAGSHNITQMQHLQSLIRLDYDQIIWLWTDCLREYDWYRENQQGVHDIYDIHINQELWCQEQISNWRPDIWHRMTVIGGNAPLQTEWPCTQMNSWAEEMGHMPRGQDHATVDPVNWRDFVNWCTGKLTIGKLDYDDTDQFSNVHELWWAWIKSFSHSHKQHHMDFLKRSQHREQVLVHGEDHHQLGKGMMGHDLHPNPDAHKWLTEWILANQHKN